jgi:hypothetical protein
VRLFGGLQFADRERASVQSLDLPSSNDRLVSSLAAEKQWLLAELARSFFFILVRIVIIICCCNQLCVLCFA